MSVDFSHKGNKLNASYEKQNRAVPLNKGCFSCLLWCETWLDFSSLLLWGKLREASDSTHPHWAPRLPCWVLKWVTVLMFESTAGVWINRVSSCVPTKQFTSQSHTRHNTNWMSSARNSFCICCASHRWATRKRSSLQWNVPSCLQKEELQFGFIMNRPSSLSETPIGNVARNRVNRLKATWL